MTKKISNYIVVALYLGMIYFLFNYYGTYTDLIRVGAMLIVTIGFLYFNLSTEVKFWSKDEERIPIIDITLIIVGCYIAAIFVITNPSKENGFLGLLALIAFALSLSIVYNGAKRLYIKILEKSYNFFNK